MKNRLGYILSSGIACDVEDAKNMNPEIKENIMKSNCHCELTNINCKYIEDVKRYANDVPQIYSRLNKIEEENEMFYSQVAKVRNLIPLEWLDKKSVHALGEVVSSPESALDYLEEYIISLQKQNENKEVIL